MRKVLSGTVRVLDVETGEKVCKSKPGWNNQLMNILVSGSRDWNQIEWRNYGMMPDEIKQYFPHITYEDEKLITEIIKDDDGMISKNLEQVNYELSEEFWKEIEICIDHMVTHDYYLYDFTKSNVLVQIFEGKQIPRLIDCKRVGWKNNPWQISLILPSERRRKMIRKLARLKK